MSLVIIVGSPPSSIEGTFILALNDSLPVNFSASASGWFSIAISKAFVRKSALGSAASYSFFAAIACAKYGVAVPKAWPAISNAPPTPPCNDFPDINADDKAKSAGVFAARRSNSGRSPCTPFNKLKYVS